jgi:hypothetical protein
MIRHSLDAVLRNGQKPRSERFGAPGCKTCAIVPGDEQSFLKDVVGGNLFQQRGPDPFLN